MNRVPQNNNEYFIFDNADIVPNRVEVFDSVQNKILEYVPPGSKVTAHLLSVCQTTDINSQNDKTCRRKIGVDLKLKELKISDATNPTLDSALTNVDSKIDPKIINEETFEEYFRVFHEVRKLMNDEVGRSGTGTLGTFANELIGSLPQSGTVPDNVLKEKGENLWKLGYEYVQGVSGKKDDRILYFARLEAMALLRDVKNRNEACRHFLQTS